MIELHADQRHKLWPLVEGWEETILWSCLQGHMGRAWADNAEDPKSARIIVSDFVFYAGKPDRAMVESTEGFFRESILTPQHEGWTALVEEIWGGRTEKLSRYAIKKEPDCFDRQKLTKLASQLPEGYSLQPMDRDLTEQALGKPWSYHLCGQFDSVEDYLRRGMGIAAVRDGRLAAAASSYSVYDTGIEIEIDTDPDHRGKGLATACGAALILACLDRGLYPSWDAADLRSVHLAEKLGYHMDGLYHAWFYKMDTP